MKTLDLVLKRKWYDMIASGEKTEEYREIKPYWVKRLIEPINLFGRDYCKEETFDTDCDNSWCEFIVPKDIRDGVIEFKDFDKVTFHLGYSKDRPSMTFAIKEIVIDEGKEEWGALPGETYFVIKLGERL